MNHEAQVDKARQISDNSLIDGTFLDYSDLTRCDDDLDDTPAVMKAFHADELFHAEMKRQAAKAAKVSA